jgi:RecB family endonuclease NucS
MVEREMQELLWRYPERFLNEPLKQFAWETSSDVGRADLVFEDRHGRLLVIEVKHGKLPRGAIDQLLDYFGMMKQRFPDKAVELMVVANPGPAEQEDCLSIHPVRILPSAAASLPFSGTATCCV